MNKTAEEPKEGTWRLGREGANTTKLVCVHGASKGFFIARFWGWLGWTSSKYLFVAFQLFFLVGLKLPGLLGTMKTDYFKHLG